MYSTIYMYCNIHLCTINVYYDIDALWYVPMSIHIYIYICPI